MFTNDVEARADCCIAQCFPRDLRFLVRMRVRHSTATPEKYRFAPNSNARRVSIRHDPRSGAARGGAARGSAHGSVSTEKDPPPARFPLRFASISRSSAGHSTCGTALPPSRWFGPTERLIRPGRGLFLKVSSSKEPAWLRRLGRDREIQGDLQLQHLGNRAAGLGSCGGLFDLRLVRAGRLHRGD